MTTLDLGLLRKKPWRRGFFYACDSPATRQARPAAGLTAVSVEVVAALRENLGLKLCAYLGSVKETRAVNEWAEGVHEPSDAVQRRLRPAFRVAGAIAEVDDPAPRLPERGSRG